MSHGIVKTIAALLTGAGLALAQPPAPSAGKMTARGTVIAKDAGVRPDATYPQAASQQTYALPPADAGEPAPAVCWGEAEYDSYRLYFSSEALLWNIRNPSLPPLTTVVPVGVVQIAQPIFVNGVAQTNTPVFSIPFSLSSDPGIPNALSLDMGEHNGVRLTGGVWFDEDQDCGLELSAFALEKLTEQVRSTTTNVTNQFNLDTTVQAQFFLSTPGAGQQLTSVADVVVPAQGRSDVVVAYQTELYGAEANIRHLGMRVGDFTFGGLVGLRCIGFEEQVRVANNVSVTDIPGETSGQDLGVLPATFQSVDIIKANNRVVAPQAGAEVEARCYCFFLNARGKVAVGANFQEIEAFGRFTSTTPTGGTISGPGGLLSGPSNQGTYERTRVTVVPEINVKVGWEVGAFRTWVGYDALYMQNMARAGGQVSFTNTVTQLTVADSSTSLGVRQPIIVVRDLDVWVQGINLGLELRF